MASSSPATPDTPITLKVSFLGSTRRYTLPLSDLSANSLLDKIRQLLCISPDANAIFERHSDSAAAYVKLDPSNTSVWKQLYRAAKAKRKLKLRVTLHDSEDEDEEIDEQTSQDSNGPKPVTVEDEPEQQTQLFAQIKPEAPLVSLSEQSIESNNADISPREAATNFLEQAMSELRLGSEKQEKDNYLSSNSSMCVAPKAANFAVCCNNCDRTIPDAHYHCSTCDDGDFDLCPDCVEKGVTCYNSDHWLLKRFVRGDFILVSTTERVSPKPKPQEKEPEAKPAPVACPKELPKFTSLPIRSTAPATLRSLLAAPMRTCNSCVQELPDKEFLHCLTCDDFDLCKACFANDQHGHHPQHGFAPAVEGTSMPPNILRRLAPGRDQRHHAICDGCDKFIFGIRHKCLDCPDWDYCADCIVNAGFVHPDHRFVPIYDQIADARTIATPRPCHYGICCDGPLCNGVRKTYIVGERYKCAVCHDTDFCAACEASPANNHNKTHPLIKFKTPVRRVEVKTKGEDENGQKMPVMGDRLTRKSVTPRPATTSCPASSSPVTSLHTVVDVKPEPEKAVSPVKATAQAHDQQNAISAHERIQQEFEQQQRVIEASRKAIVQASPIAIFERDTIADGTVMPPNQVFQQTWFLRNGGDTPWPAGCSVKFVGGDYMGHVDSAHPAGIHDLVSASESTVCYDALAPGKEFPFTVLLRTPAREGNFVSHWRLQADDGLKFGHRLWCDVTVEAPKAVEAPKVEKLEETSDASAQSSQMIFPKLANEVPEGGAWEEASDKQGEAEELSNFSDCGEEIWVDSDEGLLTDDEYDILDASDEEFSDEQQKKARK
ncbi:hypothetical protein N0V93_000783 [Gnomoniopsis smithogilvyi]|uniref:ZZ-type domain-containing protein n=1 Tax=Gnomoniopsis smithogilvyi TaxID=1191159 RepID=A0A9W8Z2M4_9PEZI|nr:hypothetical protein N0V93_000783 [Gnomoniopsis smithogilvyi]